MVNQTLRIRVIFLVIFCLVATIATKLYFIQIVNGEEYAERGENQYVRTGNYLYNRGDILFSRRDGIEVPAATLKSGFKAVMNPQLIIDPEGVYTQMEEFIDMEKEEFVQAASDADRTRVVIGEQMTDEDASGLRNLNLKGVVISRDRWRHYPGGSMGADVVGFVGYDQDGFTGRYGLERYYDDTLDRSGDQRFVNFFAEVFSNIQNNLLGAEESEGHVVTSIEPTVQIFLEERIKEVTEEWDSKYTGGIIIDPNSGEIYAMADFPTYDPNKYEEVEDASVFTNTAVESVFEVGSIIKAITMAAALDSGAVVPSDTYYDAGYLKIDGYTISNYDGVSRGNVDMQEVLNSSLNTGAVYAMRQMGPEVFADYLNKLKIDSETGIDLSNEAYGMIENLKSSREIEFATASYGQGIAMTPIAAVRALSALANGGLLVDPHIAREIRYDDGGVKKVEGLPQKRVFSEETSKTITKMLVNVVDEALAGGDVKLPNHSVAAKTGTAQIADAEQGGYYKDRFFHSFFGYFPAHDPKFLVFLYTYDPKDVKYSSQTLTDPFMEITKFLINYYEVPPDRRLDRTVSFGEGLR